MIDEEIYNDVFYGRDQEDSPPSKPPRTFAYEPDYFAKGTPPQKPPRSTAKSTDAIREIDLSALTSSITSDQLTHLTKNRAKLPERKHAIMARRPCSHSVGCEQKGNLGIIKTDSLDDLKRYRANSMLEFSVLRRTAIKVKKSK